MRSIHQIRFFYITITTLICLSFTQSCFTEEEKKDNQSDEVIETIAEAPSSDDGGSNDSNSSSSSESSSNSSTRSKKKTSKKKAPVAIAYAGTMQGISLKLTPNIETYAGSGVAGNTDGTAAEFNSPEGIASDTTHLYVTDANSKNIRKIEIATATTSTLAGGFAHLRGITAFGNFLYVLADKGLKRVHKTTAEVTDIASVAEFTAGGPSNLTTDGVNAYIIDQHAIRAVSLTAPHTVALIAGEPSTSGDTDNTDGTQARFNTPIGITTNGESLYVADQKNNSIRVLSIQNRVDINTITASVSTLTGSAGFGRIDGTPDAATLYSPTGITTDGIFLYIFSTRWALGGDRGAIRRLRISNPKDLDTITTLNIGSAFQMNNASSTGYDGAVHKGKLYLAHPDEHKIYALD